MEPEFEATKRGEMGFGLDEIHGLISGTPDMEGSSFTALLELPPPQAVELLVKEDFTDEQQMPPPFFPSNVSLIDRASKFSAFATSNENSLQSTILVSASGSMKVDMVKQERLDNQSRPNLSYPAISDQSLNPSKRKQREKQVKETNRKSKKSGSNDESSEKLPYVHVRARRGQATDNHSLAERARREKINARMKLLQELVPGCNKISGTALVLDEIINHVQALQRQVEFLSMRLAAVDPRIDFNLDRLLMAAENGTSIDNSNRSIFSPTILPENGMNLSRQHLYQHQFGSQQQHHPSNFITPETSHLSYGNGSPSNSASLHSSQMKMEL